ncbi:MAG: response regulator transcription factor [Acidobacteriaceae bacterium]|nr:response regulator transcription factor [Acidobacteriaceae bacterium]MBV8572668.1 response regulator transcription factor [Acidobacteriaceae bacterium]
MTSIDTEFHEAAVSAPPARAKLLFADDHHLVLDALMFVASPHYEVRGVDNLTSFDEVMREYAPDLVILDVRMPDGDGFVTAERILRSHPRVKVMFLSMYTEARYVRRAVEVGAQAYLSKRAPMEELMLAIRTVLNGGRYIGSRTQTLDERPLPPEGDLTERQVQVLRLIAQGHSAKEIANELEISVRTAEFHRAAIMERLKLHSTAMMTRYAVERGIA